MKKRFLKGIAIAMAVVMPVPAVPVSTQAASKMSISSCVISKGDKFDLDIKGIDENSGKYSTSMKAVASVTKDGIVTAKKAGNAKITWKKGNKKYTCEVKVVKAPVLSKSKLEIDEKQKETITVQKYGNKKLTVKWSSSNKKIAKVSGEGKITGLSKGKTTIKAKIKGYKKTWTREVEVTVNKESVETTKAPDVTAAPASTQAPDVTTAPVLPDITAAPATAAPTLVPTTEPTTTPTTEPTTTPTAEPQATTEPAPTTQPIIWYPVTKATSSPNEAAGGNLLKNGDFAKGEEGWNIYSITAPGEATVEIKDGKIAYNITNVGSEDWNIQLKQENITLEKGCNYRMTFNVISTEARTIKLAMLSSDGSYTWYGGEDIVLEKDLEKNADIKFTMDYPTDTKTTMVVSMGQIEDYNTKEKIPTPPSVITLSDFKLVKVDAPDTTPVPDATQTPDTTPAPDATQTPDATPAPDVTPVPDATPTPDVPDTPADDNLLKNGDFAKEKEGWDIESITSPGEAEVSFSNGSIVYNIKNVGSEDWHVQLKQEGIKLEAGCSYKITCKATSTEARKIKIAMLNSGYTWYGGSDIDLEKDVEKQVVIDFTVGNNDKGEPLPTDENITMAVSMGQMKENNQDISTPASTITLSDFKLVKVDTSDTPSDNNMLKNGDFAKEKEGWDIESITSPGEAEVSFSNGSVVYNIKNVGSEDWHVQLKQEGIKLEAGCSYKITCKATSTEARKIKIAMLNSGYTWYGGSDIDLEKDVEKQVVINFTVGNNDKGEPLPTDEKITMAVSMGQMKENNQDISTPASTITLSDFKLVKAE